MKFYKSRFGAKLRSLLTTLTTLTTKFGKSLGLGLIILVVNASLIVGLTGCGLSVRFPSDRVVARAIARQISPIYSHLSQKLSQPDPNVEISKVQVKSIVTIVVEKLPTYHLRGTYNLTLKLPHHEFKENQSFDLYVQQQRQNKSWRLLIPEISPKSSPQLSLDQLPKSKNIIWHSYLIKSS
jgi:hypothetical protein